MGEKGGMRNNWVVLIHFFGLLRPRPNVQNHSFSPTGLFLVKSEFHPKMYHTGGEGGYLE